MLVLCCDFFFLISEMSQNVYLVNLFSGEVGKHKHSGWERHHTARTPGWLADIDGNPRKQPGGATSRPERRHSPSV